MKKSKGGKRTPFTVVNGVANWHDVLGTKKTQYIVSIDPGITNFAFRIEERLHIYGNYCAVNTLIMERTQFEDKYEDYSNTLLTNITAFLDRYWLYYPSVCLFLIEDQQVTDAHRIANLAQHVISYFYFYTKLNPGAVVATVSPKAKTKYLNAPKMDRIQRVKWQGQEGLRFLHLRNDVYGLSKYQEFKDKADDIMVTLIQVEAIYRHLGLMQTEEKF